MRLFLAAMPDDSFRLTLEQLQKELKDAGIKGRYTDPFNLHLTLAFIGEYGDPDHIMDVIEEIPFEPVFLKPEKISLLGDLYILTFEENRELSLYVQRLHRVLAGNDIPFDRKSFIPHITLVRKADTDFPEFPITKTEEMECSSVSLMRSQQGRNGMNYTEIDRIAYDG